MLFPIVDVGAVEVYVTEAYSERSRRLPLLSIRIDEIDFG